MDVYDPDLIADRGFTGHEFLKYFNLYNMNGRLYDPLVGRFLNVDPYVQMPGYSQSYNRYSYCLNNPLKFTDPSGNRLAAADEFWNLDKEYTAWFSDLQYRFGHSSSAGGADGGRNFDNPWNTYESFWSSLLACVPSWQDGYSIKSSSFGKKNGVEGVYINTVIVGTTTRVGEVGSSSFKVFFFVDFTRKFIAFNNPSGQGRQYLKYDADYANSTRTLGSLIWYNSDGSEAARYIATSGSGSPKYYTLPAGNYTASNFRTTTDSKFMRNGIGFKVTLGPSSVWDTDKGAYRTSLLIHPARYNGTEGCIGLISDDKSNILDFQTRISNYLQSNKSINVIVEY
jgi:RHS repeat-associated protein